DREQPGPDEQDAAGDAGDHERLLAHEAPRLPVHVEDGLAHADDRIHRLDLLLLDLVVDLPSHVDLVRDDLLELGDVVLEVFLGGVDLGLDLVTITHGSGPFAHAPAASPLFTAPTVCWASRMGSSRSGLASWPSFL